MADEIVLMKTLHDDHDGSRALVVQAGHKGVVVELRHPTSFGLRHDVDGLDGIIHDDEIRAPPEDRAADAGRIAVSLLGCGEFHGALPASNELQLREKLFEP